MDRDQRTGPAARQRDGGAAAPPRAAPRRARPRAAPGGTRPGVRPPGVQRPAAARSAAWPRQLRRPAGVPRAPFVLLVLSLLGGGLICLLVINTTLGATSFEIDHLQQSANAKALQAQQLQNQLATDESDAKIQQEACSLGMRPRQQLEFLDLRTHRLRASASVASSPAWCPRTSQAAR